jgi:hypothetical protein
MTNDASWASRAVAAWSAIKYQAAGAAAKAKAACRARAAQAGAPVDAGCLAAVDEVLARKWAKAERRADCVTTGDASDGVAATDQCLVGIDGVVAPPPSPSSPCCDFGGSCGHGLDATACTDGLGGTLGPAGSVCDAATGACSSSPGGTGRCCMWVGGPSCTAGPTLDLSGCVGPDFLDYPFGSTCTSSGTCTAP